MNWERARNDEQKEQRISEIVQATARLYEKYQFEEITFALIAKEANFTRSNLYKYFNTKEEVFLELIKHDLSIWKNELIKTFQKKEYSTEEFANIWVDTQTKQVRLLSLFAILFTSIEKKSSLESLVSFKKKIQEEFGGLVKLLLELFPSVSLDDGTEFSFSLFALSIGIYPMLNLTENQKKAMELTGMNSDYQYYKNIYIKSIESLLQPLIKV
ncbi:MAG: hypothetical protein A2086_13045 [Spirochaetes bacterium GWD1_27_9]|nr:MAG: hypothetical protein A2Z98_12205 [Spirochaetes bacterium GWB1_27_13]OHD21961.1 MAG: hypothetical protein A2Y34_13030 [Spirochaetes bacterium GWC1_27_15]OHD43588.1 MAG: hypothetical protein A2086_13045 [Spirochaetes bacterium GWD1_27_9]